MRIPEFSGLSGFFRDAFAEMQEKKTAVLILDVRGNGGGEDRLGKLLISYLLDTPFQYYSDLLVNKLSPRFARYAEGSEPQPAGMVSRGTDGRYHFVGHPNWGLQQPTRPTFRGKVFILIDGGSFSTTAEFLSQAHFHRRATFLGEESGGGYYGNTSGDMPELTLPHSQIRMVVPLVGYYMAVGPGQPADHGVLPDRPVHYTIDEVLAGRDKEMELALELARQP
jgi:C-terminal processing protease CtpA/Prc